MQSGIRCARLQLIVACVLVQMGLESAGLAQVVRPYIWLPRYYGATAISAQINAEANYIAASGSFLESAANARLVNSKATEQEIHNSVLWLSSYFERRELNKRYTRQKTYFERQKEHNERTKNLIDSDFQIELKTDVTDKLNWMLRELNAMAPAQRFLEVGDDSLVGSAFDAKLSTDDIHHVQLTDGGHANGRLLLFRADAVEALETHWPRVLRDPEFDRVRKRFEETREEAIDELKATHEIGFKMAQRLRGSVDALCSAYNSAYPRERRAESMETHVSYLAGKKFLQSLALAVHRVIETEDQRAFDGSYRFQGDSVAKLIGHMHKFGLEFGNAQPGDEGIYRRLFFAMRDFYKKLVAEDPFQG